MQDLTLYEKDYHCLEDDKEERLSIIVFRLSREWYGIPLNSVREVLKVDKITYLPSSPEHISGIVNIRGNILSVTNLRKIFSLPHKEISGSSRLIVITSGIMETGLLVDEITEVETIPVSKIEPVLSTIAPENAIYLQGNCTLDGCLIGIIKSKSIFNR